MTTTIQLGAPRRFFIGSTLQWREYSSDYDPATWASELALVSSNSGQTFAGSDYGDGSHLIELTAAQTAALEAGLYRYQVNLTSGAVRVTFSQGVIEAVANYAAITGGIDDRSTAARIYDAISALLEGKATQDQSSLAIGGRSLSRYSWGELSEMRGYYAHQMTDEELRGRGLAKSQPKQIRFVR